MEANTILMQSFIEKAILKLSNIDKYVELMERFNNGKGCSDKKFRTLYTYFYRVRRTDAWIDKYFEVMKRFAAGEKTYSFGDILSSVDSIDGSGIEFSFASKMFATLCPDMPIWDSQVRVSLGLPNVITKGSVKDRENDACTLYGVLCKTMDTLLQEKNTIAQLRLFDETMPQYADKVSRMKKLDYLLWAAGR